MAASTQVRLGPPPQPSPQGGGSIFALTAAFLDAMCITRLKGGGSPRACSPLEGALHLALGVRGGERLALVVLALAAREADLDLGPVAGEVDAQGDQRVPALLDLADQAGYLLGVQQQLEIGRASCR